MKKLILFLFIAALPGVASFAQTNEIKLSPENEKKCVDLSRELANTLMINEPEYIKLKCLNRERLAKEEAAQKSLKNSPEQYAARLQEIETEFETKLQAILTPSQKKAFAHHKQALNSEMIVITTEE